ncbi:MAG: hypothetical protein WCC59_14495 [Terriglobales bacterium]
MQEIQITAMVPDNAQPCALPWTCKTCGASGTVVLSGVSVFALAEAAESSATLIANGIAKTACVEASGLPNEADRAALKRAHQAVSLVCIGEPAIPLYP